MEQTGYKNDNRGRIVDDYKHSIIQSVEHDEMQHGDTKAEREWYSERSYQLDENEAIAKEQYDNNYCEEVTGLSSDGYRHQVIKDYTHEQMSGNTVAERQGADYWDSSSKDASASNDSQNAIQSENADYWDNTNNSSSNDQSNENENSLSHEVVC